MLLLDWHAKIIIIGEGRQATGSQEKDILLENSR